jgi:hypothetical protein
LSRAARPPFAARLAGGDRRSIGDADAVAAAVRGEPARFDELWACLTAADPVVRMRAADALEKLGRAAPHLFAPHRAVLLSGELDDGTPELRWHLVAIASRLTLSEAEAADFAFRCNQLIRHDRSRIVRVMALQALFDVTARHASLASQLADALDFAAASALPSLRARAAKLAPRLGELSHPHQTRRRL